MSFVQLVAKARSLRLAESGVASSVNSVYHPGVNAHEL